MDCMWVRKRGEPSVVLKFWAGTTVRMNCHHLRRGTPSEGAGWREGKWEFGLGPGKFRMPTGLTHRSVGL